MRPIHRPFVTLVALLLLASAPLQAARAQSRTSAAGAEADAAANAFDDGMRRLEKADALGVKKSATYSFDYAAAPDAKAVREYEQAVVAFTKSVSLRPKRKEAHNHLGYCYRRLGKLSESLSSYDKAIDLDPDFALARGRRGEVYLALGRLDGAEAELAVLRGLDARYADQLARAISMYRAAHAD